MPCEEAQGAWRTLPEPLRHHATTKNRANRPAKGLRTFMISSSTHENVRFPGFRTEPLPTEQPRTFAMTIPQKKGSGNAGCSSEFFGVKRIMEQAPHHHARHGGRSGIRAIPLLLLRKRHIFRGRIRTVSAARRAPGRPERPPSVPAALFLTQQTFPRSVFAYPAREFMALLSLQGVTLNLGGKTLLDTADLHVEQGERVCLVGATASASRP